MSNPLDTILDVIPSQTADATKTLEGEVVPADKALMPATSNTDIVTVEPEPNKDAVRLEDDFEFARNKIREMVTKGREAIDSAILLAQSSDQPRAFEVVGKMLEAIVNANKELINLHKTRQETVTMPTPAGSLLPHTEDGNRPVNIDKAVVFTGRASDLLREIRSIAKAATVEEDKNASES